MHGVGVALPRQRHQWVPHQRREPRREHHPGPEGMPPTAMTVSAYRNHKPLLRWRTRLLLQQRLPGRLGLRRCRRCDKAGDHGSGGKETSFHPTFPIRHRGSTTADAIKRRNRAVCSREWAGARRDAGSRSSEPGSAAQSLWNNRGRAHGQRKLLLSCRRRTLSGNPADRPVRRPREDGDPGASD